MKKCPYCAESIQEEAVLCRFCGSAIPGPEELHIRPGPVLFDRRTRWGRISVAVLLAGSVPTLLSYSVLTGLLIFVGPDYTFRSSYVPFHFVVHLLPLALGIFAARAWPGRHPTGHAVLGIMAAVIEAATIWLFMAVVSPRIYQLSLRWEDFAGVVATASLFTAGGLFADLRESARYPPVRTQPSPRQTPTGGTPHRQSATRQLPLLLVQALGPAILALIGTAINAAVALATQP